MQEICVAFAESRVLGRKRLLAKGQLRSTLPLDKQYGKLLPCAHRSSFVPLCTAHFSPSAPRSYDMPLLAVRAYEETSNARRVRHADIKVKNNEIVSTDLDQITASEVFHGAMSSARDFSLESVNALSPGDEYTAVEIVKILAIRSVVHAVAQKPLTVLDPYGKKIARLGTKL